MAVPTLLLIAPPVLYAGQWWGNRRANKPHFASLAGAVGDLCEVRWLELDRQPGPDGPLTGLVQAVADIGDDLALVGISCWTSMHYLGAVLTIETLRSMRSSLPIVVGGHHASAAPRDFDGLADWVVSGDGENALRSLCLEWPKRPARTQRLAGAVVSRMDPSAIDWVNYGPNGRPERGAPVWLLAARGCPFRCHYCMEPLRGPSRSTYSVQNTLAIIEGLIDTHAPPSVAFADPLFGADRAWTLRLLDGLVERDLPVTFWAQTRADLMTPELLERFAQARFKLDFGLDSGSLTTTRLMEKSPNPARYLDRSAEMLRVADRVGLHHEIYLLFNYPGETPETAAETMRYIEALGTGRGPMAAWVSPQTFFILPGTESYSRMDDHHQRFGTVVRNPQWWKVPGDQYRLATAVLPSRAYAGREAELSSFAPWAGALNTSWSARYPPEVAAFRRRFHGGTGAAPPPP